MATKVRYNVFVGDGNHGTRLMTIVTGGGIEDAVKFARDSYAFEGEPYRREDLEEDQVLLVLDEDSKGNRAHNGAAFHVIEICREPDA